MTPQDAWTAAHHQLALQLDRASFETWLRDAAFIDCKEGIYRIEVPNDYARDVCQQRLYRNIRRILSDVSGEACELIFETKSKESTNQPDGEPIADDNPLSRFLQRLPQAPEPQSEPQSDNEGNEPDRKDNLADGWHYFARVPEAIIDTLDPQCGWLLVKIIRHIIRKTNTLIASYKDLETLSGISDSQIKREIPKLVAAGHLAVVPGRGRGNANTYHLAGRLAVAVCGAEVAAATAEQLALNSLPKPTQVPNKVAQTEPHSDDKVAQTEPHSDDKVAQTEPFSGAKVALPEPHNDKVAPTEPFSDDKVAQTEPFSGDKMALTGPPNQTSNKSPDINKNQTHAPAHEAANTQPPPAPAAVVNNFIQNQDEPDSKNDKPPRYPTLAMWVAKWGGPSASQVAALQEIDRRYDTDVIKDAFTATVNAYESGKTRYVDRLTYFQSALQRRHNKILILESASRRGNHAAVN
ncbi:hypothetical protein G4Y79_05305 [Phototrophicus methaneseepsis]|uniref:DnaA N-terminal domain-containing protein n=1 Tax=Phototrophicus methaneseepsis TaxID=2710758 RepID=A0A7S8EBN2_9CHLR|nr:DnaA N-terminal domain-containing protein [Phototrophicus methaneseepsis]QPC83798.1 hypothetical protein G4Y79_05305 [Phototrophicus methaneseepsis]